MKGRRINFEDDVVKVYNPECELIYIGIEDYEPMKDEPWKWNATTGEYELGGYRKICIA